MNRWEEASRRQPEAQPLSTSALRHYIPELLTRAAEFVRAVHEGGRVSLADLPRLHSTERMGIGFDLSSVAKELALLRSIILELWEEATATGGASSTVIREIRTLDAVLDEVVARSVHAYAEARECTPVALGSASSILTQAQLLERERKAHALLQQLLSASPIAVGFVDTQMRYVVVNAMLAALNGSSPEQHVGRRIDEVLPKKAAAFVNDLVQRVLATGKSIEHLESEIQSPTRAAPTFLLSSFFPVRTEDGSLLGVGTVSCDVTKLKEAENALRGFEERYELVCRATKDAIWDWNLTNDQVSWSQGLKTRFGFDAGDVAGNARGWFERIHPEQRDRVFRGIHQAIDAGESNWHDEYQFQTKGGGYAWVADQGYVTRDDSGRPLRMVGAMEDITERKLLVEEREQLLAEITGQHQVLARRIAFEEQLIGIVSHDLRNPLGAMSVGVSGLLRRGEHLDETSLRSLLRIRSSAERASRMVSDLLDFTQARLAGGITLKPQRANIHGIAKQVVDESRALFADRDFALESSGKGDGDVDPDRIAQVIENLVTNAARYSPKGSTVSVRTWDQTEKLGVEVHNFGPPIAADHLPQLFEPLQRGSSHRDAGSRSVGLGLYIVKQIVDAHDGDIRVESSEDTGTRMTILLPKH